VSIVELCFHGGEPPAKMPAEYREYIREIRSGFEKLDDAISEVEEMMEGEDRLDSDRVKALFFSLFFGSASAGTADCQAFVNCFVTYEERTRTVTVTGEDGQEREDEETYTVAIPVSDLSTICANLGAATGVALTEEVLSNADTIYSLVGYGASGSGFAGTDVSYIGADGFCSPVGENWRSVVTSEFGYRRDPITGEGRGHTGIDLAVPQGTAVRAALPGKVVAASYNTQGYGYYVKIDHGNGLSTLYAHNSRLLVRAGQTVRAGDIISLSGSTGRSTGPHLHFEVRVNNSQVNPRSYLP
jgi:murein DD-endopeptidase MepM/ murein hydrolase activator NlpD